MATKRITRPVKSSDIWIHLECMNPNHSRQRDGHSTFSVQVRASEFTKTCRCGQCTFAVRVENLPNKIVVKVGYVVGSNPPEWYPLQDDDIEISEA